MKKMNKKIFITGEAKITSLLRDYISVRMDADFYIVSDFELTEESRKALIISDVIILLHEFGRCNAKEAQRNFDFTQAIIQGLPQYVKNYVVADFTPRQKPDDEVSYMFKIQGERFVQQYCEAGFSRPVLYRMPEVYGAGFECEVLNRLIKTECFDDACASYELLNCDDFFDELYHLANGSPTMTGFGCYASPKGVYHSTESELLKKFKEFKNLEKWKIPDFPSSFDRCLYDYYLMKKSRTACYKLNEIVMSSQRFGALSVTRLMPGEVENISIKHASGVRVLLLCGSVSIAGKTYSAEKNILRIDVFKDVPVENVGDGIAVFEVWNHTNS